MYYAAALCLIKFHLEKVTVSKRFKLFLRLTTILLVVMIALLSSKSGILSCFAILIIALFRNLTKNENGRNTYFLVFATLLLAISVLFNPTTKSRIGSVMNAPKEAVSNIDNDKITATKRSSTKARIIVWGIALEMLCDNPSGEGVGDAKASLIRRYEKDDQYYMLSKKLNVHNQFLETGISSGLISLLFMLIMFLYLSIKAFRNRDLLMLSLLAIITLNLLTESMFERQSGAVFISLFIGLLLFRDQGENKFISS